MNRRRLAVGGIAGALALAGIGIGVATQTGSSCPSPSQIAGGGTYNATGCTINVGTGIKDVGHPLSLTGGTYTGTTNISARSIIQIINTTATLSNLTLIGTNTSGGIQFNANQAGLKLIQTTNTTITNTNISKTGGDCLEAFANPPTESKPNTNLVVTGGTYDQCGRDGISPSDVNTATFSNITTKSVGQSGIDAESDINGIGMGNVNFQTCTIQQRGVVITELLTGSVSFTSDSIAGRFLWTAKRPQSFPIVVSNGQFQAGLRAKPAIIVQNNATSLTFTDETFTRPGNGQAPLWNVSNGAHLTFNHSTLAPPLGVNDSTSTVTINP